jgi:hypothetical protein
MLYTTIECDSCQKKIDIGRDKNNYQYLELDFKEGNYSKPVLKLSHHLHLCKDCVVTVMQVLGLEDKMVMKTTPRPKKTTAK